MTELPQNWIKTTFTQIFDIQGGTQPPKSSFIYEERANYIRLLQIRDFGNKPMPTYIPFKSNLKLCSHDDVLIARYGASIGRILTGMDGAYNVAIAKVIIPDSVEKRFVYYLLNSSMFQRPILSIERSAQDGFNKDDLSKIELKIPPLNEQKRIVEKLDKMMRIVEGVNARLDKIPTALKRARQSILNQAITGELTKDWREKNLDIIPASIMIEQFKQLLLESSSKNERDNINNIFSYKENYFSFDIPHTWTFSILEKLCKSFKYGTSTKSESSGLVPVLRMGNIQKGEIDWNDLVYTSDSKEIEKYKLEKNDVLFNRTNSPELVGKTAIYRGERAVIYAGYLIKIENYKILNSEYLNYALNSTFAKEWKLDVKTDGVSQSNINAQKIAKFEVPLPPLEEQAEIVRRVKLAFEKLDKIELRYQKAKEYSDKLTQSILNKAFRGELVPQDPNDKPVEIEV